METHIREPRRTRTVRCASLDESQGIDRTRFDTGRFQFLVKAMRAEGAFLHDPHCRVELRSIIRADPGAVLATDTAVTVEQYGTGRRILAVGVCWTSEETGWLETMVAGQGIVEDSGVGKVLFVERVDVAPIDLSVDEVLGPTGDGTS